jgi:hypothetical protein
MGSCTVKHKLKKVPSIEKFEIEEFTEMPEWDGDRYKGVGIKRMKAYKCDIPINELNRMREDFWDKKVTQNYIWRHIKQACIMDEVRARSILHAYCLTPVNGCINQLQDSIGKVYRIPNYCINDPYFEKALKLEDKNRPGYNIKVKLYDLYNNKTTNIDINDNISGAELKEKFCGQSDIKDTNKVRAFFGGTEILDETSLYRYNIKNNYTIIMTTAKDL